MDWGRETRLSIQYCAVTKCCGLDWRAAVTKCDDKRTGLFLFNNWSQSLAFLSDLFQVFSNTRATYLQYHPTQRLQSFDTTSPLLRYTDVVYIPQQQTLKFTQVYYKVDC
jgi:hypothetical protein